MHLQQATQAKIVPFAVEAAWATGRWETLSKYLDISKSSDAAYADFDVAIGEVFRDMQQGRTKDLMATINSIRERIAASMGLSETASLQACHDIMLRCHVLTDLELVVTTQASEGQGSPELLNVLQRRLGVLGSHVDDKQYLLNIQRAALELRR
jgi:serine/threonine-protein kinase ATR